MSVHFVGQASPTLAFRRLSVYLSIVLLWVGSFRGAGQRDDGSDFGGIDAFALSRSRGHAVSMHSEQQHVDSSRFLSREYQYVSRYL